MIATAQATAVNVDAFLDRTLVVGPTPWFLKAEELYLVSKKAIDDLKLNDYAAVQGAISLIDNSTSTLLKTSDSVLKTSLSSDEGFSIIKVIDETLVATQKLLHTADAGVDSFHAKLIESLKSFKEATKTRVQSAYSTLSVADAKAAALNAFEGAHKIAKERFPGPTETVEGLVKKATDSTLSAKEYVTVTATNKIDEIKTATTAGVVHALEVSKPYITKAIEIGQPIVLPYVEKATPIVTPYVAFVDKTLAENAVVGPYFEAVKSHTFSALEKAQTYYVGEKPAVPVAVIEPVVVETVVAPAAPSTSKKSGKSKAIAGAPLIATE